jgi:predicted secreted protein
LPNGVKEPVQYGNSVKVSSVYLSQSQLIPLDRGRDCFQDQFGLPQYKGILVHDHLKTYFSYEECLHALCNAHYLRELERAYEQDGQKWATKMQKLLIVMKEAAENDQRMVKVQQNISGCFRSMKGAQIFCRVRSYLLTCRKNGIGATEVLELLFGGSLPSFIT